MIYLFINQSIVFLILFSFLLLYYLVILMDSAVKNKSLKVGFLSVVTTFIQFFSYGFGFLQSFIALNILRRNPENAFPSHYNKAG